MSEPVDRSARRAPDIAGVAGRAWRVERPTASDPPDWSASVAAYHVNVPGAHPFWSWWGVCMIHLRDIPGVKPAHKTAPTSTHELLIVAFDPETPPLPPELIPRSSKMLSPPDVSEQISDFDDAHAAQLLELAVRAICDGKISPDQDYRAAWKQLVAGTAAHLRAGLHDPS